MTQAPSKNIYQRINEVRRAVDYVQKEKDVDGKYKVVTHDQVLDQIRNAMVEHGIVIEPHLVSEKVVQDTLMKTTKAPIIRVESVYDINFVNIDEPLDRAITRVSAHALDTGDKAPGKVVTYASKSAMLKVFALVTGEDEERRHEGLNAQGMDPKEYADWNAAIDAVKDGEEGRKLWKQIIAACNKCGDESAVLRLKARLSARNEALRRAAKQAAAAKPAAEDATNG